MMPNIHIHEHLMLERYQELQREMEQQRMVAELRRHRFGVVRRLAAGVGTILLALGTRLKGLESHGEQATYEQSNAQETTMNRTTVA
jgi:hypothetical protein